MRSVTAGLLLGDQARVKGAQARIHDIIGNVSAQLYSTATFTRKVLHENLAAVDEPEVALRALLPHTPAQRSKQNCQICCWLARVAKESTCSVLYIPSLY